MWSKDAISLLISKYREHDNLYYMSHPHYPDRVKRSISLLAICKDVKPLVPGVTADEVKKKMRSLRSQYVRELREMLNFKRMGFTEDVFEPKLWCFWELEFLRPFCATRRLEEAVFGESTTAPIPPPKRMKVEEKNEIVNVAAEATAPIPPPKRIKVEEKNEIVNVVVEANEDDGENALMIAQGWCSQYAELSRHQKVYARKIISFILFHGCLENLTQSTAGEIQKIIESNVGKRYDPLHNEE